MSNCEPFNRARFSKSLRSISGHSLSKLEISNVIEDKEGSKPHKFILQIWIRFTGLAYYIYTEVSYTSFWIDFEGINIVYEVYVGTFSL